MFIHAFILFYELVYFHLSKVIRIMNTKISMTYWVYIISTTLDRVMQNKTMK